MTKGTPKPWYLDVNQKMRRVDAMQFMNAMLDLECRIYDSGTGKTIALNEDKQCLVVRWESVTLGCQLVGRQEYYANGKVVNWLSFDLR